MDKISTEMPWVKFYLHDKLFALSTKNIREMVVMPKVVPIPQAPDYIRGVINLRGQTYSVMDLRLRTGMKSLLNETDDLIQLLTQREEDHKKWIKELETSVREERDFTLATDPHKCAFGKWYDNYKTDNRILESCLKKFNKPHQKIHAIAIRVKEMAENNKFESAYEIINQTKEGELAEMVKLFSEARTLLRDTSREIAIVLEFDNRTLVVSVDSVATVEILLESNIEEMSAAITTTSNDFILGIGKRDNGKSLFQLLDIEKLFCQKRNPTGDISNIA